MLTLMKRGHTANFIQSFFVIHLITYHLSLSLLYAAFEHIPSNPSNIATGILTANIQTNSLGILSDPASVTHFDDLHIGLSSGNRYGISMLGHHSGAGAQRIGMYYLGLLVGSMGDKTYNETILNITVGKRFSDKIKAGIGIVHYGLSIKSYGATNTIGLNFGWNIQLDETINWVGVWRNMNGPVIGISKDPLPQVFSTAMIYQPIKATTVVLEVEQDTEYESRLKFGTRIHLLPWITAFLGQATSPDQTTGGFEILFKQFNINYAVTTHTYLGLSHWIGTGFSFR